MCIRDSKQVDPKEHGDGSGSCGGCHDPHAPDTVSYTPLTPPTSDLVEISVVPGTIKKKTKKTTGLGNTRKGAEQLTDIQ